MFPYGYLCMHAWVHAYILVTFYQYIGALVTEAIANASWMIKKTECPQQINKDSSHLEERPLLYFDLLMVLFCFILGFIYIFL